MMKHGTITKILVGMLIWGMFFSLRGIKVYAASDTIYYDNPNLKPIWEIDKSSLQKVNNKTMSVQNFSRYGRTNTFFLTQHSGVSTYLYRCTLGTDGIIRATDYIYLNGFGHGESVEVTNYNSSTNTYTVWIGSAGGQTEDAWSRGIARIKYTVDNTSFSGAVASEIKLMRGFNRVIGVEEVEIRTAVGIAENDDRICFCTQIDNKKGNWYYLVYSLSEMNRVLDNCNNAVAMLQYLNINYKSMFSLTYDGLPNKSFQSIDIDGVGNNQKLLFLAGGKPEENSQINQYLYTNGGKLTKLHEYIIMNSVAPQNNFLYNAEIEGVKIYSDEGIDYMYILFKKYGKTDARIYRYPVK